MPTATPSSGPAKSRLERAFPALLFGYAAVMLVCGLLIDATRRRTFFDHAVQRHIYLGFFIAVVCVYVIAYIATLVTVVRTAWSWKSRALLSVMYLFLTLRWVLFFAVLPFTVAEALFYHLPRTPWVFQSTVQQSDSYRNRSTRIQAATFTLPSGERVRLTESEWKPLHLFTAPILVNDQCALGELQPGLPITVYGRRSSLGYAIDRITSAEPCERKAE